MSGLQAHLARGSTTLARAWAIARSDGAVLGFTDHDRDLEFEGIRFRADSGLTARALQQTTGLAVDNTEAAGALSDAALTEADLMAGRYDGAELRIWWVNWADVSERLLQFRGTLGEVAREGRAFRAELRGLSEPLGQPGGRVFQAACTAVLGDAACGVDTAQPGYSVEVSVEAVEDAVRFRLAGLAGFDDRWFEKGRLTVLSGAAQGLVGVVKLDRAGPEGAREVELWQRLGAPVAVGDLLRLEAGCDKRAETCRLKFANFLNFRGFPDIPGEDWLMAVPREGAPNDGRSLKR
jgi:uncharacterized phage protein (TIGR02218 family)